MSPIIYGSRGKRSGLLLTKMEAMGGLGKFLVLTGGVLVLLGLLLMAGSRLNLPVGRLPGDIVYRGKNTTFYFPIVTSILLSVLLSVILYLVNRFTR